MRFHRNDGCRGHAAIRVKVLLSAIVVVAVSGLGKRSSLWCALLAAVASLLAFVWFWRVTGNVAAIAALSTGIFRLVLASLPLLLSALLRQIRGPANKGTGSINLS